jgi:hypothetical protein
MSRKSSVRSFFGAVVVLVFWGGLVGQADAEDLKPPETLIFTRPAEPPKAIPELPCATDALRAELKAKLEQWQKDFRLIEDNDAKQDELAKKITELQGEYKTATPSMKDSIDKKIADAKLSLVAAILTIKNALPNVRKDENRYNGLIAFIQKQCAPPQASSQPLDPCVVGEWRSTDVSSKYGDTGGSGIKLVIAEDGTETIDYNGMKPIEGLSGTQNQWSGTAKGKIAAAGGKASVVSVEQSDVELHFTQHGATRASPIRKMGPASLGENKFDTSYECTPTTLSFKLLVFDLVFKRESGATRTR